MCLVFLCACVRVCSLYRRLANNFCVIPFCFLVQRFLSQIEHPNIIKLRAVASCDPCSGDFFLVLDRLYDTLHQRIRKWRNTRIASLSLAGIIKDPQGKKLKELLERRISFAFDLSAAVCHLHKYKIIHRDLKPENIGFDIVRSRRHFASCGTVFDSRMSDVVYVNT